MFIASTARNYGLNVTATTDERLNPTAETDAAMRYLASNQLRFKDWLLAIQAYNSGEQAVQVAIEKFGSRDVWTLLQQGLLTDHDYLAKVMAMIIIMKNPQLLE
jgi:membrane-bound lytic murein transglycosylase D